jgi:Rrf2 family iron-sulfur cluster assembly transcriptional regulator
MISLSAEYALRAVLFLGRPGTVRAISADEIASATGAPRNYMAKVLNVVAKAGLISGTRGPTGGFTLAVPAADITLGRVIDLFDSTVSNPRCMMGSGPCDPAHPCRAHDAWNAVATARRSPFNSTTIADLLEGRVASIPFETNLESCHVA